MKRFFAVLLALVVIFTACLSTVSAASYPLITYSSSKSTPTIISGQVGKLAFMILTEYHNERYNVEIYNSKNQKVAAASNSYYNSDGTFYRDVTITVNTADLDLSVGKYKVVYWMEFYSLYQWNTAPNKYTATFEVIANTCKGNHDFTLDYIWTEPTCEKEGLGRYICDDCGHTVYEAMPKAHDYGDWESAGSYSHTRTCKTCSGTDTVSHTFGAGIVTKKPSCAEEGVKTYTCTVCGGTKNEAIAKTTNHIFGEWEPDTDAVHKHVCTLCYTSERSSHTWGQGSVTQEPNCTVEGIMTYTCSICKGTKTEAIPVNDRHIYGEHIEVDGISHKQECTLCAKEKTEAHTWDKGTYVVKPTLESVGMKQYTCTTCGGTKDEITPKRSSGDVDGNFILDDQDAVYLLYHTFLSDTYPVDTDCDFNNDGEVTDQDAVYLLYHTFLPDLYPIS